MYYDYFKDVYKKGIFWAILLALLLLRFFLCEIQSCNRPPRYLRQMFPGKTDAELREMENTYNQVPELKALLEDMENQE